MRPHIARAARRAGVRGFTGNSSTEVFIEAQGDLAAFEECLNADLPPLAFIVERETSDLPDLPPGAEDGFDIVESTLKEGETTLIPPDTSICADCLADIADPENRRYQYPFTTCTNCGPRLSIIESLPYDRPNTTLKDFPLCPQCAAEYSDPRDRRFHAQPISCPDCGPSAWLELPGSTARIEGDFMDLVAQVRAAWDAGQIVAVRGIGGFHLTCDATNSAAVELLRERKHRPTKPLALMVPTLADAARLGAPHPLLESAARPIVSVPMTPQAPSDLPGIAPGLDTVGLMLPYSPLHCLLVDRPIVATSGNLSGQPLVYGLEEARAQLSGLCDLFLMHDREIHVPVEDSVFIAAGASSATPVRRSRGLAPVPIPLPEGPTVLAVGGELKNTFTLAIGRWGHMSAHVGDMGTLAAQENFTRAVEQLSTLRGAEPELVACDLHPGYSTTAWAERFADRLGIEVCYVQHHHAHALSLMAEHGIDLRDNGKAAVVAALDGTGYGTDGTIWGGEVLTLRGAGFERSWHLPGFGLAGGDRAVREPWRLALAVHPGLKLPDSPEVRLVRSQLESGLGVVHTSSVGRLFDAASYLLGAVETVSYEGEAAMRLEALAARVQPGAGAPLAESYEELLARLLEPGDAALRARQFHRDLAGLIARAMVTAAAAAGTDVVGVTGGSAVNGILLGYLTGDLRAAGFEPLVHRAIPPGDGGLSLGQALGARLG